MHIPALSKLCRILSLERCQLILTGLQALIGRNALGILAAAQTNARQAQQDHAPYPLPLNFHNHRTERELTQMVSSNPLLFLIC
jgi:hypothetical protein